MLNNASFANTIALFAVLFVCAFAQPSHAAESFGDPLLGYQKGAYYYVTSDIENSCRSSDEITVVLPTYVAPAVLSTRQSLGSLMYGAMSDYRRLCRTRDHTVNRVEEVQLVFYYDDQMLLSGTLIDDEGPATGFGARWDERFSLTDMRFGTEENLKISKARDPEHLFITAAFNSTLDVPNRDEAKLAYLKFEYEETNNAEVMLETALRDAYLEHKVAKIGKRLSDAELSALRLPSSYNRNHFCEDEFLKRIDDAAKLGHRFSVALVAECLLHKSSRKYVISDVVDPDTGKELLVFDDAGERHVHAIIYAAHAQSEAVLNGYLIGRQFRDFEAQYNDLADAVTNGYEIPALF